MKKIILLCFHLFIMNSYAEIAPKTQQEKIDEFLSINQEEYDIWDPYKNYPKLLGRVEHS